MPIVRRAIRAWRDRAHDLGVRRRRDRGDLRPGLRAQRPARRDPARRPALGTDARDAGRGRRTRSAARRSCSRSARSSRARTSRTSSPRSDGSPATHPELRLVIAGHDGPARPAVDAAIARLPATRATAVVLPGRVSDAGRRALLDGAAVLAYPSIYEGFGFPVLEAMTRRRAGGRGARPARSPRSRATPRCSSSRPTRPTSRRRSTRCSPTTRRARELIARGRDRVRDFSWEDTALALASCYRRLADSDDQASMRVALHAGQLLQPVPGGIGRYVRELLAAPARRRRRADRVRGRRAPAQRARARSRGSTSGAPHGSVRYELWHRSAPGRAHRGRRGARAEPRGPARAARAARRHRPRHRVPPGPRGTTRRGVRVPPARLSTSRGATRRSCSRRRRSRASS